MFPRSNFPSKSLANNYSITRNDCSDLRRYLAHFAFTPSREFDGSQHQSPIAEFFRQVMRLVWMQPGSFNCIYPIGINSCGVGDPKGIDQLFVL